MNGGTSHRREGWGDGQLQQPTGPVEEEENKVSELLSVSEDSARTEDMEDEEDVEFCWEPLVTAAPVLLKQVVRGLHHFSSVPPSPAPLYILALSTPPQCVPSHPAACL